MDKSWSDAERYAFVFLVNAGYRAFRYRRCWNGDRPGMSTVVWAKSVYSTLPDAYPPEEYQTDLNPHTGVWVPRGGVEYDAEKTKQRIIQALGPGGIRPARDSDITSPYDALVVIEDEEGRLVVEYFTKVGAVRYQDFVKMTKTFAQ